MIRIKLIKSTIGTTPKVRKTVKALGLNKLNQVRDCKEDNLALMGMVKSVKTYLQIEEIK